MTKIGVKNMWFVSVTLLLVMSATATMTIQKNTHSMPLEDINTCNTDDVKYWDILVCGSNDCKYGMDLQKQANCYEAAFQTVWDREWLRDMYWWNWEPDSNAGGPNDKGYVPHNKPAETVCTNWYGATGQLELSPPKTLAFYYGWYGDENQDWKHWESADPVGDTTWYLPLLGAYSSLNSSVIEQHVEWAKYAGIDGFIFSWWHKDFELDHFRKGLGLLISIAEGKDFKISVYLETEEEYPVADQINYLIDQGYCDSAAWYYKDDKPVFYVYERITSDYEGTDGHPNGYWSYVRSQIDREIYLNLDLYSWPYEGDALHMYIYDINYDDFRDWEGFNGFLWNVKNVNYGEYSLTVNPGFDDTVLGIGGNLQASREGGERYRMQWEATLDIDTTPYYPGYCADEILITSWNEWHETTSIEPAVEWGLEYLNITAEYICNRPPDKPTKPSGPTSGKTGIEYTYNTTTTDPQGDQVYYLWDWGDGNFSEWLGPYNSGEVCEATHIWNTQGDFQIKVIAKNSDGLVSEWSDPLAISMPKNKAINPLFLRFLERHPRLFPILRLLLEL